MLSWLTPGLSIFQALIKTWSTVKFKTEATTLFQPHSISHSVTHYLSLSVLPCPYQAFTCFHSVYKRICPWTEYHSISAFQQTLFSFEGLSKHNISHDKKSPNSPKVLSPNLPKVCQQNPVSVKKSQFKENPKLSLTLKNISGQRWMSDKHSFQIMILKNIFKNVVMNRTKRFEKCKQLLEYQNLLLISDN